MTTYLEDDLSSSDYNKECFYFRQSHGVVVFALNMADSSQTFWIGEKVALKIDHHVFKKFNYFLSCSGESFGVPAVAVRWRSTGRYIPNFAPYLNDFGNA